MVDNIQRQHVPCAVWALSIPPFIGRASRILGSVISYRTVRLCPLVAVMLVAAAVYSLPAAAQDDAKAIRDISEIEVDEERLRQAIASRTLTWLTGSSSNNDHVSVGRLANFFGFVALRVSSGHSLKRSDVAKSTLAVMTESQIDALVALVERQKPPFERTQAARYEMNRALEGLLVGETITDEEFLALGAAYGESEAELGRVIGQGLGEVAQSLTADQQSELSAIRVANLAGRGHEIESPGVKVRLGQEDKKELVNIAARLLSWTTGSEAFNDFEVVGKPSQHFGFVSLRMESNHGVRRSDVAKEVWAMLTPEQQGMIDIAVDQNATAFEAFLAVRGRLMRTLEAALAGEAIDVDKVRELGSTVGALEGRMTWVQAMAMLGVRNSMSEKQLNDLLAMRAKYTAGSKTAALPEDPVERGRQLFAQCALCHQSSDQQSIAPDLTGIVGRRIAADASFDTYSPALYSFAEAEEVWNEALLDNFLEHPKTLVPGTFMGYDGLDAAADRSALIAYLKTKR